MRDCVTLRVPLPGSWMGHSTLLHHYSLNSMWFVHPSATLLSLVSTGSWGVPLCHTGSVRHPRIPGWPHYCHHGLWVSSYEGCDINLRTPGKDPWLLLPSDTEYMEESTESGPRHTLLWGGGCQAPLWHAWWSGLSTTWWRPRRPRLPSWQHSRRTRITYWLLRLYICVWWISSHTATTMSRWVCSTYSCTPDATYIWAFHLERPWHHPGWRL